MKANRKGRTKGGGRFAALHLFIMQSAAWRACSVQDRAVYLELLALYDGKNNGWLALSARDAADRCNINKDTAAKCLRRLAERGLIDCTQEGAYSYKLRHAAEWRLTQHRCDRTGAPPSRAFQQWRPE